MYIYCVIFIILAVLAIEYEIKAIKRIDFILAIIGVLLTLFVGLRDISVSRDYLPYLGTFNYILHTDGFGNNTLLPLFEPGFVFIVKISYYIFPENGNVAVMLLFASLSIGIKFFVFRKLAFNPFLVLLLYYSHFFLIQEMTQIRNGLACSFFFLALYYYLKNEKFKVLGCIILAILFHNSAIVYFLLFFVRKDKLNPGFYGAIFIGAIIAGLVRLTLIPYLLPDLNVADISTKLTTYVEDANSLFITKIRFFNVLNIVNVFLTGYIFFYCVKFKVKDPKLILFLKCNIISIFMYGLLINVPSMAARVTELYNSVFPFLFVYILKMPPFGKWNIMIVVGVALLYFGINLFYGHLLQPYEIIHIK